jgi:hypothetical protein
MTKVPGWYWAVAVLALVWGAIASGGYVAGVSMTEADLAELPPVQAEAWRASPPWLMGVYAVAVWSCLAGAVGLLLRKAWARPVYVLSLAAAVVQFVYSLSTTRLLEVEGLSAAMLPIFIWIAGAFLIWFSGLGLRRGWLR